MWNYRIDYVKKGLNFGPPNRHCSGSQGALYQRKNVTTALKAIPRQEFTKCFQQWQHRWVKCTAAEGEGVPGR